MIFHGGQGPSAMKNGAAALRRQRNIKTGGIVAAAKNRPSEIAIPPENRSSNDNKKRTPALPGSFFYPLQLRGVSMTCWGQIDLGFW
jgi:hypothetical protein